MFTFTQKGLFRPFTAALTLFVWIFAQAACFLHCNYPPDITSSALAAEATRCCSTAKDDALPDGKNSPTSSCITLKRVILKSAPDQLLQFNQVLIEWAMIPLQSHAIEIGYASVSAHRVDEASPPAALERLNDFLLSLPPPRLA